MDKSPLIKKVERIIVPTAEGMGYEIVRVLLVGAAGSKPTLQIMAEKPDRSMGIEDCSRLSQAVSAVLDVEGVFDEAAYYLEISSPGVDRPLTRLKDFEDFKENEARIEIDEPIEKQKKFKGILKGTQHDDTVVLETEKGLVNIPFSAIHKAKLVLTDKLLKIAQAQQKKQAKAKKSTDEDDNENSDTFSVYAELSDSKKKLYPKSKAALKKSAKGKSKV